MMNINSAGYTLQACIVRDEARDETLNRQHPLPETQLYNICGYEEDLHAYRI